MNLRRTIAAAAALAAVAPALGAVHPEPGLPSGAPAQPAGERLARQSDCFSCHAIDHKVVGPALADVAKRYRGQADVVPKLADKIRAGGSGAWGDVAMTPHPNLSTANLTAIVQWVLSLKAQAVAGTAARHRTYDYELPGGRTVKLDFPLFTHGHEVSKDVFAGWEQFNSYCFRCHGTDAGGSEYAPDLRHSLAGGMKREQFVAIAMAGRPDKGMPSWAGFFTPREIEQVYDYVKGRSVGLLGPGRPEASGG